jgi:hypothetical protein
MPGVRRLQYQRRLVSRFALSLGREPVLLILLVKVGSANMMLTIPDALRSMLKLSI